MLKHPTSGGGSHIVLLCVVAGYRGAGVTNILAQTQTQTINSNTFVFLFFFLFSFLFTFVWY